LVESTDSGITWAIRDDFINVSIWDMKAVDDQVVLATHGRGIWSVTLDGMTWPTELVTDLPENTIDGGLALSSFPNPVVNATTIKYFLPSATKARIDIIAIDGKLVNSFELGLLDHGAGEFTWNRKHKSLSSGVYLIKLETDHGSMVSRMILD
jgi:hypothetical protein